LEVRAFDGTLSGRITFSGGSGVSFDSDLRARGIQMETLLGQFAGITRFTGAGATDLRLTGRGNSVDALMNSLTGTGSIDLGQGTIRGIDLAALMRNLQQAFGGFEGATEFTSLTGTFSMNAGVLENIDLSLIAPLFRAGGKGTVDVGGQAMNYTVTPTRFADGAEFTVPVTITGAWSNLRIRPDVEALVALLANADLSGAEEIARAQEKLAEVKGLLENPEAAIEDRLKAELSRRLAEEVSIPGATPAPTPTDTTIGGGKEVAAAPQTDLRDQVEDTLRDQLRRRLLGGESDVKPTPAPTPKPTAEAPASQGDGNGLAPVLSLRPRVRPAGLNTTVTAAPSAPDAPADTTAAAPADNRSTEERIKDELEDKAKDELRKLFKLGD
ncbi:MAG: AsmA-like C-terminal region-containing protein, partial [Pseudomonadota bacterium]